VKTRKLIDKFTEDYGEYYYYSEEEEDEDEEDQDLLDEFDEEEMEDESAEGWQEATGMVRNP
jgi:hypothetical protein